jgi:hypothetical protein
MWSEEEIQFLFDNPNMSLKDLAAHLRGRTEGSIRAKRSRLKIVAGSERGKKPWTEKEREIVYLHYGKLSKVEVMELLPDRTWDSIRSQASWLRKHKHKVGEYE